MLYKEVFVLFCFFPVKRCNVTQESYEDGRHYGILIVCNETSPNQPVPPVLKIQTISFHCKWPCKTTGQHIVEKLNHLGHGTLSPGD